MSATIKAFERPGTASESPSPARPVETPPAEGLALHHVPPAVAARFSEALACYGHGLWQACAAMCRLTVEAVLADVGSAGRMRIFDLVNEVQDAASLDDQSFGVVRAVLFEGAPVTPAFSRWQAAVLVETLKDLLTQQYIRPARLRQAFAVRRFFATEAAAPGSKPA